MAKKKTVAEKREPFKIGSFTASGAKVLAKQYEKMGYKLVSSKYDEKKQMYYNTYK